MGTAPACRGRGFGMASQADDSQSEHFFEGPRD